VGLAKYVSELIICCSLMSEADETFEIFLGVKHETKGKAIHALFTSF